MANKGFVAIYVKQQGKHKIKRTYIIYTKMQHKKIKQNKKKMLTRWARYGIILLSQGEKRKLKLKSETGIKMGWRYLDNHPFGKMNFEINFKMRI